MEFWQGFWTVLLVVSLTAFAGLAVVVSIGGFFDVKALFKRLEDQHRDRKG